MLCPAWDQLPQAEFGLGYMRSYAAHRCDLASVGLSTKHFPTRYHYHNARRSVGCIFQYTLAGEGRFHDGRRVLPVPAGCGFLVETPSPTEYRLPRPDEVAGPPVWRFAYLTLVGDASCYHVRRLLSHHGPIVSLALLSVPVTIMLDLYRRMLEGEEPDELTINMEVQRFLLELTRALRTPTHRLPDAVVAACDYVERFLAEPGLTVEDLARAACYSRFHFTRLFKLHMGVTPYQYLVQRRIRRAMDLLTSTSRPIKQIALEVGFSNVSWFCNAFRHQMQATPSQVRARSQATESSSEVQTR